jgi:Arc/MetJ-type ribon-helix-helix transcriptional regulator
LKPELVKFVAEKVKAGQFANASDVVNKALEVLREQEEFSPQQQEYHRASSFHWWGLRRRPLRHRLGATTSSI